MRATVLGCAIAAVLLSGTAMAQETEPAGSTFEEVIVTAQRREQSIYDVPVALSAFTPDTIERQGIQDLTDIGKFEPNLNVTGFSAGHTSSANPFIRGIGLQDHLITTEPGVGVYIDGVYLGRQVGQNWSLSNIERVEVLRGPQGTLFGKNTTGGASFLARNAGAVRNVYARIGELETSQLGEPQSRLEERFLGPLLAAIGLWLCARLLQTTWWQVAP